MSSDEHEVTRHVYAMVLSADGKSPMAPESDEEKPAGEAVRETHEKTNPAPRPVRIDLPNLEQRVVPLPLPARNYEDLRTGKSGTVYVLEGAAPEEQMRGRTLQKYD